MCSFMLVQHKRFSVELLLLKYDTILRAAQLPCCLEFSKVISNSSVNRINLFGFAYR